MILPQPADSDPRLAAAALRPAAFANPGEAPWSVVWSHGAGCPQLASLLADGRPQRAGPDVPASCIAARADVLVARRLTSFDLVPVVVPHGFDPRSVRAVVAAVAGGPHSLFAARVAERLGAALGVPTSLIAASAGSRSDDHAEAALGRAAAAVSMPEGRVVRAANPGAAVRALPAGSLLVLGAPGGTWWRRQFAGAGHQLRTGAPAGAVVVRTAPRRCFQEMSPPAAMGREMPALAARQLTAEPVIPVAESGRLIGLVRRQALDAATPATTLGSLMEPPCSVRLEDPLEAALSAASLLEGAAVPVVDGENRLCGLLSLSSAPPPR